MTVQAGAKRRLGPPLREKPLLHAPWSTLSWGVFIPAVFAGNVVLAIFAWFVVEWITKLI
jgi:hypothetical protein